MDARIKSGHDELVPATRCARVFLKRPAFWKSEGAGKAGCPLHPQPRV